ncbi:hypothetical protein [Rhodoferax sp.]|uniref:hypothetical protein n=1 Tax=Rhodoferax sp. TaxID=50421 RepID=UPI0025F2B010|nr:hypothetical protein [Rhodoferax sp.]
MIQRTSVKLAVLLGAAALLSACTPTMNWRKVPLGDVGFNLPCKPDSATRKQQIGAQTVSLDVTGCEAGGALFAVSHVALASAESHVGLQKAWQQQTLQSMRAHTVGAEAWAPPPWGSHAKAMSATGTDPRGQVVKAHLIWFLRGQHLYHLAIYTPSLSPEWALTFTEDLTPL